jgi:hypothetical protein
LFGYYTFWQAAARVIEKRNRDILALPDIHSGNIAEFNIISSHGLWPEISINDIDMNMAVSR